MAPMVSTATGENMWLFSRFEYFRHFSVSASEATTPAPALDLETWLGAKVSRQVKSQTRHLPLLYWINVIPSGRFPSCRQMPVGSRMDG